MARATLASLIAEVRTLTGAGTAEYTIGTVAYWSDDHIEALLDRGRVDVIEEPLAVVSRRVGAGSVEWREYRSRYGDYEATTGGTAIFEVRDSLGAPVGTADYAVDYTRGIVTFATSTGGSAYYLTGRSYDRYGAAALLLRAWSGYLARAIDFETANQAFKASQQRQGLLALAAEYQRQARVSGMSGEWERTDLCEPDWTERRRWST